MSTQIFPLALYVHWPFCKAKCPYCDFNSHVREGVDHVAWRAALLTELAYVAQRLPARRLSSIFFGGGTPSLMQPETVGAIIEAAKKLWPAAEDIEITLEANPTSVEAAALAAFKAAGVNRVSLGVQALNDKDLAFLGRKHSAKEAMQAVELAAGLFDRMSFDLIYARPGQSLAEWEAELSRALPYTKGHISLYQLTIEEGTAFHHAYGKQEFTLPEEGLAAELYALTHRLTAQHGLFAYEVSNYAAPRQESAHNLTYWRGEEYAGIGPGAHGRVMIGGQRVATLTQKSPERWLEQVQKNGQGGMEETPLTEEEQLEERIMMGLRLYEGIALEAFAQQTGRSLMSLLPASKLDLLQRENLIVATTTHLRATEKGMLVLSSITRELLA